MAKKAASAFTSERDAPEKETAAHYLVARREWLERYGDYISGTWSAPFPSGPKAGTGTGPAIAFPDGSALRSGVQAGLSADWTGPVSAVLRSGPGQGVLQKPPGGSVRDQSAPFLEPSARTRCRPGVPAAGPARRKRSGSGTHTRQTAVVPGGRGLPLQSVSSRRRSIRSNRSRMRSMACLS